MRRLTVVNCSTETVSCHVGRQDTCEAQSDISILPASSTTLEIPSFRRSALILTPQAARSKSAAGLDEKQAVAPDRLAVRVPLSLGALWKEVDVPEGCAWRVYRSKVRPAGVEMVQGAWAHRSVQITRKHHQLLVIPRRKLHAFLSEIPDTVPLSCLTLPGTHDTYVHAYALPNGYSPNPVWPSMAGRYHSASHSKRRSQYNLPRVFAYWTFG